jgi:YD repeat-containing protein
VLVSETTILAAPDTDNVLQTRDGRVTLRVPPGALPVAATISHQPILTTARSSVLYPFELNARRQDGVSLTTFARPLPLTLHYSGLLTRSLDPSERLFIVTFNEQTRQWEEIRTTHDRANQTLSVELKHFSTYGIGQSDASMTQETLPSVRGMGQVDLFSGAASFNFPIQLPAGPGGFQPSLALHYSTSAVNDRTLNSNNTLGLYLGDGWKLSDLPMVIRNSNGTPTNDADDSFFLSSAVGNGELVYWPTAAGGDNYYHTLDESFVRVAFSNNVWYLTAKDGTRYVLSPTTYYFTMDAGTNCWSERNVTNKWHVTQITDTHNNLITFQYSVPSGYFRHKCWESAVGWHYEQASYYGRAVHPTLIQYGGTQPGQGVEVKFSYENKPDIGAACEDEGPSNNWYNQTMRDQVACDKQRLAEIQVWANNQLARSYALGYTGSSQLTSFTPKGTNGAALPAYTFIYGATGDDQGYLIKANNGYGGEVELHYLKEHFNSYCDDYNCPNNQWFDRWVLANKTTRAYLNGSIASEYRSEYEYVGPTMQSGGQFVGHSLVREKTFAGGVGSALLAQTETSFVQRMSSPTWYVDPRQGKAWQIDQKDGVGALLARTNHAYAYAERYHRSDITAQNLNFNWLYETNHYQYEGSANYVRTRTEYWYDNVYNATTYYGNLVAEFRHGDVNTTADDVSVHRGMAPNLNAYIVNKPAFENVYQGIVANVGSGCGCWKTQTLYYYDANTAYNQAPSKGDLVKTEVYDMVYNPSTPITTRQTVDSYGNVTSVTDPRNNTTYTAYDPVYHVLPIAATNALGHTSHTAYDLTLQKPLYVIEPSGAMTQFAYDVFGRRTKVIRPGDNTTYPTVQYDYADTIPFRLTTSQRETSNYGGTIPTIQYYNGLGQLIETKVETVDGYQQSVAHISYNAFGLKDKEYAPYLVNYGSFAPPAFWDYTPLPNPAPLSTQYHYDALGRAVRVVAPDGASSTSVYAVNQYSQRYLTQVDANGHYRFNVSDALGRLSYAVETLTTLEEGFSSLDSGRWSASSNVLVSNGLLQTTGQGAWATNVYRSTYNLTGSGQGQGIKVEFKLNSVNDAMVAALESSNAAYTRFGIYVHNNQIFAQYRMNGGAWTEVAVLNPVEANTWYVLTLKNHNTGGVGWSYIEVWKKDDPSKHGSWLLQMPANQSYRFHHWIDSGIAWLDNYHELQYYNTTYTYDVMSRLTNVVDTFSNTTVITYDNLGRKTGMSDPDMGVWSYGYDANSNLTSQTDAKAQTLNFSYDALNRLTTKTGAGLNVTYGYDGNSTTLWSDGFDSTNSGWTYSGASVSGSQAHITGPNYWCNYLQRTAAVADGVGMEVSFRFTAAGWDGIYADSGTWQQADYRRIGLIIDGAWIKAETYTGASASQTSLLPLEVGTWYRLRIVPHGQRLSTVLLWKVSAPQTRAAASIAWNESATRTWRFSDCAYNGSHDLDTYSEYITAPIGTVGQRTTMTDGSGNTSWKYDARGRMVTETKTIVGVGMFTTSMTYDAADRIVSMRYPDGEVVTTTYNARGLPTTLSSNQVGTLVSSSSYNALGQLTAQTTGSNVTTNYTYFANNYRLQRIQVGASLLDMQYVYDAVGNVTRITDTSNSGQVLAFQYDALNRLLTATTTLVGNGQYSQYYAYNAIGNITSKSDVGSYTYVVTKPHAATSAGSYLYQYDANGNMTTRTENGVAFTQNWNVENRLSSVSASGVSVTFVYDGDGNRVKKTENGVTTVYVGGLYELSACQPVSWTNLANVSVSGNTLTKSSGGDGWNAGATSAQSFASGAGYVEFVADASNPNWRMVGLSNGNSTSDYSDLDFALYLASDSIVYIYEQGVNRGGFGAYVPGDRLRVGVENGVVTYYKNGQWLYTSGVTPVYPLLVDSSIYRNGGQIIAATLCGGALTSVTKYYALGGKRVALRNAMGVTYLHGDHLGSASVTSGATSNSARYPSTRSGCTCPSAAPVGRVALRRTFASQGSAKRAASDCMITTRAIMTHCLDGS